MKTFLVALLLVCSVCSAQDVVNKRLSQTTSYFYQTLKSKSVSATDDTTVSMALGGYSRLGLSITSTVGQLITVYTDTKHYGQTAWTAIDTTAVNTGVRPLGSVITLRDNLTENAGAISDSVRFRVSFPFPENGGTYVVRLNYR